MFDMPSEIETTVSLSDRFVVPPFSVLDARQGYWQKRKREWLSIGIKSEVGRGDNALGESEGVNSRQGNGEGHLARGSVGNGPARTFGQDLMRGEHVVERAATSPARSELLADSGGGAWIGGPKTASTDKFSKTRMGQPTINGTFGPAESAGGMESQTGTSIFDPVLCELSYRWFCPAGGTILDPFSGGSVRGIVAHKLDRKYVGIDLSARQIEANYEQALDIIPESPPVWHVGDSRNVRALAGDDAPYDFVFTCPPYADLEVYSDDPRDLSTMGYEQFIEAYRNIIGESVFMLAPDRFACIVVGDVRDRKGIYRNFVSHTIQAFEDAGARLYNEAILVTSVGSLPVRVGKQFTSGRKLGKTHQNVLVFVKGDPKKATAKAGHIELSGLSDGFEVAS
jgi:DNA modification methylase